MPTPFSVPPSTRRVLAPGTGALVKAGQRVTVDYLGIDGTDGHQILSSYGEQAAEFVLDAKQAMPGIVDLARRRPRRVPRARGAGAKDAYGVQGQPAAGIGPTDTIVVLLDVKAARDVLTGRPGGRWRRAGLPVVATTPRARRRSRCPRGTPPGHLVVQPLIAGRGRR